MHAYIQAVETRPDGTRDTFCTIKARAEYRPMWWHTAGRTYTASGYGARIPTPYMVEFGGRMRRVYCRIYSNIGTCFIGRNIREGHIVSGVENG